MRSEKSRVVVERSFGRVRIAVTKLRAGSQHDYEVIHHPVPMDHTYQPDLYYCDSEAEALDRYETWCEAEVSGRRESREEVAQREEPEPALVETTDLDGRRLMRRVDAGEVRFAAALEALEAEGRFPDRVIVRCIDGFSDDAVSADERQQAVRFVKAARSRPHLDRLIRSVGELIKLRRPGFDPWVDACRLVEFIGELGQPEHAAAVERIAHPGSGVSVSSEGEATLRAELERASARCAQRRS